MWTGGRGAGTFGHCAGNGSAVGEEHTGSGEGGLNKKGVQRLVCWSFCHV